MEIQNPCEQKVFLTSDDTPSRFVSNRKHLKAVTVPLAIIIVKASLFYVWNCHAANR